MVIPEISFIHSPLFGNLGGGMYPGISMVSILYKNRRTQLRLASKLKDTYWLMLLKIQRQNQVQAQFDQVVKSRWAGPGFSVSRWLSEVLRVHTFLFYVLIHILHEIKVLSSRVPSASPGVDGTSWAAWLNWWPCDVPSNVGPGFGALPWSKLGTMGIGCCSLNNQAPPWEQWRWAESQAVFSLTRNLVITHSPQSGGWKVLPAWPGRSVPVHQGFCIPRQRRALPSLLPFLDLGLGMT